MRVIITLIVVFQFTGCASMYNNERTYNIVNMSETKQQVIDISNTNQKNDLKEYWLPLKRVEPKYPHKALRKKQSRCLDIVFSIDSSGKASSFYVRNSDINDDFVKNAARALTRWKWQASKTNPNRMGVITSTRVNFSVSETPIVDIFNECS